MFAEFRESQLLHSGLYCSKRRGSGDKGNRSAMELSWPNVGLPALIAPVSFC